MFQNTSNSKPETYSYQDKYKPDAVFVYLGANDYSTLFKPGQQTFIFGFEKLLTQIVNLQMASTGNRPKIIGVCSADDFAGAVCEKVKKAIASFSYAYDKAYYVEIPAGIFEKGDFGCVGHPSAAGQRKIADAIYERVKAIL